MEKFTLKSGNSTPFKMMGSSPAKYEKPRKGSLNPIGPRGPEGSFKTVHPDDYGDKAGATPTTIETKPITRKTSTGGTMPTGETEVKTTTRSTYKKGGETYSKVRGLVAEKRTETAVIGPKGKQKGKTKINETGGPWARGQSESDPSYGGLMTPKYNPKTRTIR